MKVLLINGSQHKNGCTARALGEIEKKLAENGVQFERLWIGVKSISGCIACGSCNGHCALPDDGVNEAIDKLESSDALIIGSPVYYASPNGSLLSFLDRLFYATPREKLAGKLGAAVASARRAGTTASLDVLNKYFLINGMSVVGSSYWNMVFGNTPDEIEQDAEGLSTMRALADNISWLLRCIEEGKKAGLAVPKLAKTATTNFIR